MEDSKFLYGAAVQGIQSFIFQTNKLKDIVGASELVEEICTSEFNKAVALYKEYDGTSGCILHAAGNIKYIFDNEEDCKKVVLEFPKRISEFAPGITVSQAVVKMEGENADFSKAVDILESRLRTQRNKPMRSSNLGLMGIKRSQQTGLPATEQINGDFLDAGTFAKRFDSDNKEREIKSLCMTAFGKERLDNKTIAYDIEDITGKNDWVAVIHADGNGLGQIVQKVGKDPKQFKEFSENLDKATTNAAISAFESVKNEFKEEKCIPIRPIVLGGDDFTVICRGDIAIDYATEFLHQFEEKTKKHLGEIISCHFSIGW